MHLHLINLHIPNIWENFSADVIWGKKFAVTKSAILLFWLLEQVWFGEKAAPQKPKEKTERITLPKCESSAFCAGIWFCDSNCWSSFNDKDRPVPSYLNKINTWAVNCVNTLSTRTSVCQLPIWAWTKQLKIKFVEKPRPPYMHKSQKVHIVHWNQIIPIDSWCKED